MVPRNPDWWIPWSFVAFFAVIVAVNGALVFFALDSWTGLETTDAYGKGIHYNRVLDAEAAQRALGWHAALAVNPRPSGETVVTVRLRDRSGGALDGARVGIRFVRPTKAGYDVSVALRPRGKGLYGARVKLPLAGQWILQIRAERTGRKAVWSRRVETR